MVVHRRVVGRRSAEMAVHTPEEQVVHKRVLVAAWAVVVVDRNRDTAHKPVVFVVVATASWEAAHNHCNLVVAAAAAVRSRRPGHPNCCHSAARKPPWPRRRAPS